LYVTGFADDYSDGFFVTMMAYPAYWTCTLGLYYLATFAVTDTNGSSIRFGSYFTNIITMSKPDTPEGVLTFVPNLIGYGRVVLCGVSFVLMMARPKTQWKLAIALYFASFVGDLIDGWVARKLKQTSSFGGVLDMVTDRCGTMGLLFILGDEYRKADEALDFPAWKLLFLSLQILDISSHWLQMHSSLALGMHHKSEDGNKKKNVLVRWFYKHYLFFGYLCCGAEFT
jgi:CDP-diacylglycerol--inositol 3-phosphatidyltransferase